MNNKALTSVDQSAFIKVPIVGNPTEGLYKVNVRDTNISGTILQTHYIYVEASCIDDIHIKWLAKDGYYKFGTFSKFQNSYNKIKQGQTIPTYFTQLSETKSRETVLTKELQKGLELSKNRVDSNKLDYYLDLASSPKVYMNIGDVVTDNWIEVQVQWSPSYSFKTNFHNIKVKFNLPKSYIQQL